MVNVNSPRYINTVVGHEITHVLEGSKLYDALEAAVIAYAKEKGTYRDVVKATYDMYSGVEGYTGTEGHRKIKQEAVANMVGDYLFTDKNFINRLATKNPNIFQKLWNEIKYMVKLATAGSNEKKKLLQVQKAFEEAYREVTQKAGKAEQSQEQKNTAEDGGVRYSLNADAETELHNALYDTNYGGEVLLRDESPAIMLAQKGVKNLPMSMNASHIRENVFTEEEAKNLGLKVDEHTHYHGLGEAFFLKVIDGLDNVTLAYRGTKNAANPSRRENYFLLVSEFQDQDGNTVNVPVYIDEHAQINRVFIDVNKISTVFGREEFQDYINRQVKNGNLVRIKNRDIKTSEHDTLIVPRYGDDASYGVTVPQESPDVKHSLSNGDVLPMRQGNYHVAGEEVAFDDLLPMAEAWDQTKAQTSSDVSQTNVVAEEELLPMALKKIAERFQNSRPDKAQNLQKLIALEQRYIAEFSREIAEKEAQLAAMEHPYSKAAKELRSEIEKLQQKLANVEKNLAKRQEALTQAQQEAEQAAVAEETKSYGRRGIRCCVLV